MSKKRPHRSTSKEAHDSVKDHKSVMYEKIITGLEKLKVGGTFEEIAKSSGLEPAQVWKRLPEMVEMGKVYNVGTTRSTSSGRKAMIRQLVGLEYNEGVNVIIKKPDGRKKETRVIHNPIFDNI